MDLKFLLCVIMITPIFGDNSNPEADRARSSWNFGGHNSGNKKTALSEWGKQRSTIPGSAVAANRRQWTNSRRGPALLIQPRQYTSFSKSLKTGKLMKTMKNSPTMQFPSLSLPSKLSQHHQSFYSHPPLNQQKMQKQPLNGWNRGARMLIKDSDTILSKFRMEDLWHLDKGEGYPLKNEDVLYDALQRKYKGLISNSLEDDNQKIVLNRRKRDVVDQPQDSEQNVPTQSQTPVIQNRISSPGSRKHYAAMPNGKSPIPQPPVGSNLKVPATIIAPPKFDKSDILSMLMGSSGVNPTNMGTILATNSRYVRFGRGLPNRGAPGKSRKERKIRWFPETPKNHMNHNHQSHSVNNIQPTSLPSNPQPITSSSNHMPSVMLSPPPSSSILNQRPASAPYSFSPQIIPSPSSATYTSNSYQMASKPPQQPFSPPSGTPSFPLLFNTQYTSMEPLSSFRSHVIPVPIQSPVQQIQQAQSLPYQNYQNIHDIIEGNSQTYGDGFKYSEFWKPVYKAKSKPQKPFKQTQEQNTEDSPNNFEIAPVFANQQNYAHDLDSDNVGASKTLSYSQSTSTEEQNKNLNEITHDLQNYESSLSAELNVDNEHSVNINNFNRYPDDYYSLIQKVAGYVPEVASFNEIEKEFR